jgi:hypothetical protein
MNSGSCVSVVELRGSNPDPTRKNTALPPCSLRPGPVQSRSLPASLFSGLDGVKTSLPFPWDLIVTKGTAKVAVQCKRKAQPMGVAAIQQVLLALRFATARPRWW